MSMLACATEVPMLRNAANKDVRQTDNQTPYTPNRAAVSDANPNFNLAKLEPEPQTTWASSSPTSNSDGRRHELCITHVLAKEKRCRWCKWPSSVPAESHSTHFASSEVEVAAASSPLMGAVAEALSCRCRPVQTLPSSSQPEKLRCRVHYQQTMQYPGSAAIDRGRCVGSHCRPKGRSRLHSHRQKHFVGWNWRGALDADCCDRRIW